MENFTRQALKNALREVQMQAIDGDDEAIDELGRSVNALFISLRRVVRAKNTTPEHTVRALEWLKDNLDMAVDVNQAVQRHMEGVA